MEEIVGMSSFSAPSLTGAQAISHEFINSLTSVRALTELLVDNPGINAGDRTRFLSIINKETKRLMRLLRHLDGAPAPDTPITKMPG